MVGEDEEKLLVHVNSHFKQEESAASSSASASSSDFASRPSSVSPEYVCPLCDLDVGDSETLKLHANQHLEEIEQAQDRELALQIQEQGKVKPKKQSLPPKHHEDEVIQVQSDEEGVEREVISLLQRHYRVGCANPLKAHLVSDLDLYCNDSRPDSEEIYRVIQTLMSCSEDIVSEVPSVGDLKKSLAKARRGIVDLSKAVNILERSGFLCNLTSFDTRTAQGRQHLLDHSWNYFQEKCAESQCSYCRAMTKASARILPPLLFSNERLMVVVGCEIAYDGSKSLLVLTGDSEPVAELRRTGVVQFRHTASSALWAEAPTTFVVLRQDPADKGASVSAEPLSSDLWGRWSVGNPRRRAYLPLPSQQGKKGSTPQRQSRHEMLPTAVGVSATVIGLLSTVLLLWYHLYS